MSQQNGYIGRSPGDSAVVIASQTFEPTGIQTDFTFAAGYDPGYIDVYFNGARLVYANDYTATNGSSVGLTTYANNGDVLELVAYKAFNVGNVQEAAANFTVGNQLTVVGATTATTAYYTGIVTASSFSGDGSALTGVANTDFINATQLNVIGVATASSFVGDGSGLTGVASTDNIITGVAVTIGGILRVTDTTQSTSSTTGAVIVSGGVGIAKSLNVGGNISVGGTLTYEDVTNVDVVGLATFRSGVQFGLAGVGGTIDGVGNAILSGITTIGTGLSFADNKKASFGNSNDLQIYHDASNAFIANNGSGDFYIQGGNVRIRNVAGSANLAQFVQSGKVGLFFNGSEKFETHNTGVNVTGSATISSDLNVAGITTVGILTAYESITVKVGAGSTELTTALSAKASTGKAIAMAMVFGF